MRNAVLLVTVLIATTGCDQITSKLNGEAGASAETADGAVTASIATAAADAGKAPPSAAPTPSASASAAPNVDAKGRPCKQGEVAANGECKKLCSSDSQCKNGGFVCSGVIPGRTDKYCGNPVCKPGEKALRENHFTLTCMVPCKGDAECKGGKKCGATLYYNEEANGATTRACE
jgi:hypothetical protein